MVRKRRLCDNDVTNQKARKENQMTTIMAVKPSDVKKQAVRSLPMIVALAITLGVVSAAEPKANSENKLVGTWKLLSAKYGGEEHKFGEGITTIKHVTPAQFMWASYDKDGKLTRSAGGDYTLKGTAYEETPRYGMSADFDIIKGKVQAFTCKVEGNKWHHNGKLSNGLTIEEVWERVESK
jgi:hypothetical protein